MKAVLARAFKTYCAILAFGVTLTATVTAAAAPAETRQFSDRTGDVPAKDLDVTGGRVVRATGNISFVITVAARVKGNAVYGINVACGGNTAMLAVKRAAGSTDAFVFNFDTNRNIPVAGVIEGRTILAQARASDLGCASGRLRFDVFAEPTNGRRGEPDRVPASGKLTL